jgi:nucleoside-triphosphate--adenylate kinase
MARGGLVPDDLMLKIVTDKLDSLHNKVCNPLLLVRILSDSWPALDPRRVPSYLEARPTLGGTFEVSSSISRSARTQLIPHSSKQKTPLTLVVNLNVPDQVILNRISDRWVHLPSGRVYNSSYNPPRVAGIDDVTGEGLTRRPDDNPVRNCAG